MSFPLRPSYSLNKIRKAGKNLVKKNLSDTKKDNALEVVNKWRVAHAYPISTFNSYLRKQVKKYVANPKKAIVAQRLKRLPTIIDKLKREPNMSLVTMQDIGGIRAIVSNVPEVFKIKDHYVNSKNITHNLIKVRNYIVNPKESGYRGIHLIYKYNNTKSNNPAAKSYKGMQIEIQLRTNLQHEWATAVETVSIFQRHDYKSGIGNPEWLNFFTLTSAIFASTEKSNTLPQFSDTNLVNIIDNLIKLENKHHFLDQLEGYSFATEIISKESTGHYTVIILNYDDKTVRIKPYKRDDLEQASVDLASIEKELSEGAHIDAVLVAAGKLKTLKKAYPNYFLDMTDFVKKVKVIVNESNLL